MQRRRTCLAWVAAAVLAFTASAPAFAGPYVFTLDGDPGAGFFHEDDFVIASLTPGGQPGDAWEYDTAGTGSTQVMPDAGWLTVDADGPAVTWSGWMPAVLFQTGALQSLRVIFGDDELSLDEHLAGGAYVGVMDERLAGGFTVSAQATDGFDILVGQVAVPEPGSLALAVLAGAGFVAARRRRSRRA